MKKIAIISCILLLTGCGLSKVDQEQNSNIGVIVQAHNALVEQVKKVTEATDKAFGSNITRRQDIFREAIATPAPTATPEVK